MKLAFTVCSNNYLSQAKVLCSSLTLHNPDYHFVIGLCDTKSDAVDYANFAPAEIVEADKIGIENFAWMTENYDIVELNTAVKPFYFEYFMRQHPDAEIVMYFDPDIMVYAPFAPIEQELSGKSVLLTPHTTTTVPNDGFSPALNTFLAYGIYNLGFLAINTNDEAKKIIRWWAEWLAKHCIKNLKSGFFVDQLPMNYVPLFFDSVCVSKNLGLNYAYWNMHERQLSLLHGQYFINHRFPLIFTHFSAFTPKFPLVICRFRNFRYQLQEGTLLHDFFADYCNRLNSADFWTLKTISCHYVVLRNEILQKQRLAEKRNFKKRLKNVGRNLRHLFDY